MPLLLMPLLLMPLLLLQIGLGSICACAKSVTDDMLVAAAHALADYTSPQQLEQGRLYPDIKVSLIKRVLGLRPGWGGVY